MRDDISAGAAARLTAFAVAGTVTTAQEVASAVLREIPEADPGLVAEETLTMISVVSARAVEAGSNGEVARLVAQTLLDLPSSYHDYLLGGSMLETGGPSSANDVAVYDRLARKKAFYAVHLGAGQLPTARALKDKMELWMGRVSPRGLSEHPAARLARMALLPDVDRHVKLIYEFARREDATRTIPSE